ncbi:hypothetical protein [Streptomyces ipomoeae]|uniref:hypothetical protein n=1 Tax=Streptomyces ipomoeae TaxID=103232 RepID=UPI000662AE2D|nr:hypothetical protein [Streptomyces ipomoeae]
MTPAPGVVLPESDVARWMLFAPPPERVDEEEETEFDAVPPTGAFPEAAEASRSALVSAESARSALAAAEPDAVPPGPPFPGTPEACRRAAGSVRRCTAGVVGPLVSGVGRWGVGDGGTGVTRGPVGRVARIGCGARCIGSSAVADALTGSGGSSFATGRVSEGGSSPGTGLPGVVTTSLTSPAGASRRTAWDNVPVKDGFCQVVNRPPNPASATPLRPTTAR